MTLSESGERSFRRTDLGRVGNAAERIEITTADASSPVRAEKFLVLRAARTPPPTFKRSATTLEVALLLDAAPRTFPVCAYLPLRDCGLRFVLQADWDVPAARNQVKEDSAWNQWLREVAAVAVADAFQIAREVEGGRDGELLRLLPPEESSVEPWFRPLVVSLYKEMRGRACLRTSDGSAEPWVRPSQALHFPTTVAAAARAVLTPADLEASQLSLLHPAVQDLLAAEDRLAARLKVRVLTQGLLLDVLEAAAHRGALAERPAPWCARALLLLYAFVDDSSDTHARALERMRALPLLPLDGAGRACAKGHVFQRADSSAERYSFERALPTVADALFEEVAPADRPVLSLFLSVHLRVPRREPKVLLGFLEAFLEKDVSVRDAVDVARWLLENEAALGAAADGVVIFLLSFIMNSG